MQGSREFSSTPAATASSKALKQRLEARLEQAIRMGQQLERLGKPHEVVLLAKGSSDFPDEAYEFFQKLWDELREHEGVAHPFLDRFARESLTLEQVKIFGNHYYQHAKMFLHYLAYVIPGLERESSQFILMENLVDEYGSFDPEWVHPAVYRSFLKSVGLQPSDWNGLKPLPEVELYIDRHMAMCRFGDPVMGAGALGVGTEWFVPTMFTQIHSGLRGSPEVPEESLTYWTAHITLDVLHSYEAMRALVPFLDTSRNRAAIREGALRSLDARKLLWDGMSRVTFN